MRTAMIIVGISGGVDSSVAALRLQAGGHSIAGLFMHNWEDAAASPVCQADTDRMDAVAVCGRLGIPFYFRNFSQAYWDGVFCHFLAEYRAGRTPNPDILCNREIKFKQFVAEARTLGAERIATGHYAQIDHQGGKWRLLRARDGQKDQSYFLHQLGQEQLAITLFPLGALEKVAVRELALQARLPTHAKKDSTGICFIGKRNFRSFLANYLPSQPGPICDPAGLVIGEHPGVFYFTLGQREGLNIGGLQGRESSAWYVVGKNVHTNCLYVDQRQDSPYLFSRTLTTEIAHWIAGAPPAATFTCTVKTRYRQGDVPCLATIQSDGTVNVRFEGPQRAVTPGQSAVFYQGPVCLGGAVIATTDAPLERAGKTLLMK